MSPQRGFQCPGKVNPNGSDNVYQTFESRYCIEQCQQQCLPSSILVQIQSKLSWDKHRGFYLSVTSLLGCLRQLYLERTINYYVEPARCWYSLRGSILHHLLENPGLDSIIDDLVKEVSRRVDDIPDNKESVNTILSEAVESLNKLNELLPKKEIPNWESETEYEYQTGWLVDKTGMLYAANVIAENPTFYVNLELKPLMLYGTIDVLRPETGELYDYKTIGDRGIQVIKNGAKADHIMQFNIYRLLVERGRPRGYKGEYVPVIINKITAFYMTMMQVVKTGGLLVETTPWRISEPSSHPSMLGEPLEVAAKIETRLKRGKKIATAELEDYNLVNNRRFKLTYAIPEVPLMDLDEVARFIYNTVPILNEAFTMGTIPPMCSPKDRLWRCNDYCPEHVRLACDERNAITGEVRETPVIDTEIPVEE